MTIKELIRKERQFARYEHQVKFRAHVTEEDVQRIGGKELGSVVHEDKYFLPKGRTIHNATELVRIRLEGGENHLFMYEGLVAHARSRTRLVFSRHLAPGELAEIRKNYDEIIDVNKRRTIYILNNVVINLDKVENLGSFIEFEVSKAEDHQAIDRLAKALSLDDGLAINLSYFEMAVKEMKGSTRFLSKLHERFGRFAFGISSAVLTTLGIIVGLNTATASRLAVIGGIVAVAVADSLSDAMGMYSSKTSERGVSSSAAVKAAMNTFLGKIVFTLTFIIPFLIWPLQTAIYVSIIWGLFLLAFVSVQMAYVREERMIKMIAQNLGIAIVVIIVSYAAGEAVAIISG